MGARTCLCHLAVTWLPSTMIVHFISGSLFLQGYSWAEDKEHCEEYGRMLNANPAKVSQRAKQRGLTQLGTLGAGNHYAEIQVTLVPISYTDFRQ